MAQQWLPTDYGSFPVREGMNDIRLLWIHPASAPEAVVECDLRTVSLDDNPEYAALSYVWGPPVFDHLVSCGGKTFPVTASLYAALRAFRRTGWQMLWVDQICIDQSNAVERSRQVLLIELIYSKASQSLRSTWPSSRADPEGVIHENAAYKKFPKLTVNAIHDLARAVGRNNSNNSLPPPNPTWEWGAWLDLLQPPIFSRRWIIQELMLGKRVAALSEHWHFDLKLLLYSQSALMALSYSAGQPYSRYSDILESQNPGGSHAASNMASPLSKGLDTWDLLWTFRNRKASDPRDNLYALRSIASDGESLPKPNYDLTVEEVYRAYACWLIEKGEGARLLPAATGCRTTPLHLPSWCPDFGWQSDDNPALGDMVFHNTDRLARSTQMPRAAGDSQSCLEIVPGSNLLRALGAIVDEVYDVDMTSQENIDLPRDMNDRLVRWAKSSTEFLRKIEVRLLLPELDLEDQQKLACGREDLGCFDTELEFQGPYGVLEVAFRMLLVPGDDLLLPKCHPLFASHNHGSVLLHHLLQQRLCLTEKGRVGLVGRATRKGGLVAVIMGGSLLTLLRREQRPHGNGPEAHRLVGNGYFLGLMNGEALEDESFAPGDILLA